MSDQIIHLLATSEVYCAAVGIAEATLSSRMLRDGKRLGRIRTGADIGVRTCRAAMGWLSDHWPEGAPWPPDVPRPAPPGAPPAGSTALSPSSTVEPVGPIEGDPNR